MMKEYIKQFYSEGLATTFYQKPLNYLKRKIKNKKLINFLSIIIKVIYTLIVLSLAGYILYQKLK